MSLFLEDSQYDIWFEDLFDQVLFFLKSEGQFIMEGECDELCSLASQLSLRDNIKNIKVEKDLSGKDRYLLFQKV